LTFELALLGMTIAPIAKNLTQSIIPKKINILWVICCKRT